MIIQMFLTVLCFIAVGFLFNRVTVNKAIQYISMYKNLFVEGIHHQHRATENMQFVCFLISLAVRVQTSNSNLLDFCGPKG
jgi:hypothetical protein